MNFTHMSITIPIASATSTVARVGVYIDTNVVISKVFSIWFRHHYVFTRYSIHGMSLSTYSFTHFRCFSVFVNSSLKTKRKYTVHMFYTKYPVSTNHVKTCKQ